MLGRGHRFAKGLVPWNTGKKIGSRPGSVATQFKPGQQPHTTMPLGSERLVDGYRYVKVADVPKVAYTVNWKLLHYLVWERENGPVPAGHVLRFKGGNRMNVALENLELLSLAENQARNSIHRYPREVRDVIRLQARLERAIEQRSAA